MNCYEHEECEYNAQPLCCLPSAQICPHGVAQRPTMDLIEREAAKAKIEPDEYYHSNEVKAILEDLPTIDAAPVVHSKWKFLNDYESRCSSCGKEIFIDHDDEYRYCPNCGCKMDGGEGHESN